MQEKSDHEILLPPGSSEQAAELSAELPVLGVSEEGGVVDNNASESDLGQGEASGEQPHVPPGAAEGDPQNVQRRWRHGQLRELIGHAGTLLLENQIDPASLLAPGLRRGYSIMHDPTVPNGDVAAYLGIRQEHVSTYAKRILERLLRSAPEGVLPPEDFQPAGRVKHHESSEALPVGLRLSVMRRAIAKTRKELQLRPLAQQLGVSTDMLVRFFNAESFPDAERILLPLAGCLELSDEETEALRDAYEKEAWQNIHVGPVDEESDQR